MSHFNASATSWDSPEKVNMMSHLAIRVIKLYPEVFKKDKTYDIMDFGAGTGLFGLEFLEYSKNLTAIDTSEAMLEQLKIKTSGQNNIFTCNIDLEAKDLNQTFDIILTSMAFHHLKKPEEVILKFKEMLNPNGKILIVDLCKEDGSFHPDNHKMGVKHFGFSENEIKNWAKLTDMKSDYHVINKIEKNNKFYDQFLALYF